MTNKKYGFIYEWINHSNGKRYIGSHYGHIDDRYICSGELMLADYKHNSDAFERIILEILQTDDKKEILAREKYYLCLISDNDFVNYYNQTRLAGSWPETIYLRRKDGDYTDAEQVVYDNMRKHGIIEGTLAARRKRVTLTENEIAGYKNRKERMANGELTSAESAMITRKALGIFTEKELSGFNRRKNRARTEAEKQGHNKSIETKRNAGTLGKRYEITFPDLHIEVVTNLKEFCIKHNLSYSAMRNNHKSKGFIKKYLD